MQAAHEEAEVSRRQEVRAVSEGKEEHTRRLMVQHAQVRVPRIATVQQLTG